MDFKKLVLVSACALSFSANAADQEFFSYGDAAFTNVIAAAGEVGMIAALRQYANFTATQALPDRSLAAGPLSADDINRIMDVVEDSPLARFGLGTAGGAVLTIDKDAAQVNRMIGVKNGNVAASKVQPIEVNANSKETYAVNVNEAPAGAAAGESVVEMAERAKPQFAVENIKIRNAGTQQDLRELLVRLQDSGAHVRSVTFRGVLPRLGGAAVGTVQLLFLGGAVGNGISAVYNADAMEMTNAQPSAWEVERCGVQATPGAPQQASCDSPRYWKYLVNTSEAVFYHFATE